MHAAVYIASFDISYDNNNDGNASHDDVSFYVYSFISLKIKVLLASATNRKFKWNLQCNMKIGGKQLLFWVKHFIVTLHTLFASLYNATPVTILQILDDYMFYAQCLQ